MLYGSIEIEERICLKCGGRMVNIDDHLHTYPNEPDCLCDAGDEESMKEVIVQSKIKKKKCDKCDQYGTLVVTEDTGTIYRPHCSCPYGQWREKHEEDGDMFFNARHMR